jgi:hypothetical protein
MKHNAILVVTSLLSILLLTLHITDDIVRGISKAEPSNIALLILAVFLYGTLVLAERRSGHVIMLLVGLFAAGMPVIHMRGAHYGEIAKATGGFFFVWTLWALGALGGFTFILSASRRADCGVCDGASRGSPCSYRSILLVLRRFTSRLVLGTPWCSGGNVHGLFTLQIGHGSLPPWFNRSRCLGAPQGRSLSRSVSAKERRRTERIELSS